jgi:nitrite reductase (NO-forming)
LQRVRIVLATLALASLGVAAALVVPALGASSKVVTVRVTAHEFKFTLSRSSVPVGTVVFKVTNKGKIGHNFKIGGKKTPLLAPGKSATLKVVFKKKGKFGYLCTIAGHAKLGMAGKLGVGVKAPVSVTTTTTTATTTVAGPSTTINVSMTEYHFALSQTTVPQGNVTFVVKNDGQQTHNFDLQGKHIGGFLDPGQSETWTVNLASRTYHYVCDVPYHAASGMEGDLVVS